MKGFAWENTTGHDLHHTDCACVAAYCFLFSFVATVDSGFFGGDCKDLARQDVVFSGVLSDQTGPIFPGLGEIFVLRRAGFEGGDPHAFDLNSSICKCFKAFPTTLVTHPVHRAQSYSMGQAATRLLVYAGVLAVGVGTAAVVLSGPPKMKPGMRVFLLGDSLAVGLSRPLSALARDHKIAFESMAISGTRIDQWANNQTLFAAINKFKPDLILISLGTNDEYMKLDAKARQEPHIKKLLATLRASAPVAWIGPPKLPKSGTNGAIPLILDNVPSSHYYPSQKLDIPRAPDKLHPTTGGYAGWAAKVWGWIT